MRKRSGRGTESDVLPQLKNARSAFSCAVKESKDLLDLVRQLIKDRSEHSEIRVESTVQGD